MQEDFEKLRNFYNHRLALNYGDSPSKETPEFWDSRAESFAKKVHSAKSRKESEAFLDYFVWEEGESVLDVAAGPGTFSIPLAQRGCKVVATDFSKEMLKQLKIQAEKENSAPIDCIQGRWLELNLEEQFDTVLCMSGLGVISTDARHEAKLGEALEKLYKLAKKRLIILIPHADSHLDYRMREILGKEEIPIERLRIALIYYAMVDHGMLPSLKIIKKPFTWIFSNLEEAISTLFRKDGVEKISDPTLKRFKEYLSEKIKQDSDGNLSLSYETSQALFTIEKESRK